jgi:pyroglutamyl-peptidase
VVSVILITGFKPFSIFKRNPSGEIAELIDGSYFRGKEVIGRSFEMSRKAVIEEYIPELEKKYDPILNLSVSPGLNAVSLEKIAINWSEIHTDEELVPPSSGFIVNDAPDGIFSRIPLMDILESLRSSRIPSRISYSAGAGIGNMISFYSLFLTRSKAGLIQFPVDISDALDGKYPSMGIDLMIKSVEIAIQKTI